ncbi:hypothetical protein CSOJ01_11426 [Colletotrichum sojae]|uniref:Uncharacterized protein n=1 Tax=Colletotrichum sojae TaxID=2175907 RepID=A0A8H6IXS3_9PEZI|nr:hypothetical protein CSOJ01_11426 [Colletotrichum sojae]
MAREGTRSQTGNSKPRIFPVIDTAPTRQKRTTPAASAKPKSTTTTSAATAKGAKPVGITKKKVANAKKEPTVATKAKSVAKTAKTKATGAVKSGKKACIPPPTRGATVSLTPSQETTPKATKPKAATTETAAP